MQVLRTRLYQYTQADACGFAAVVDCATLFALAAMLRFVRLGHASLWIDELFSVCWSQLDVRFLLGEGAWTETNPPAYYVLLHVWMKIFGSTEIAIRSLSALISTATVLVVYATGRMLADRRMALLAGVFMAVNPVAVASAQEARAYALSALLGGLGLLSIVGYFRHLDTAGTRSWLWMTAFVCAMIASVSVHYTASLFVTACFAAIGWRLVTTRPFPVKETIVWIVAGMLTTLALAKLLVLAASLSRSNNLVWIAPLTGWSVVSFFLELIVALPQAGLFQTVSWVACASLLLIVVGALPRLRGDRELPGVLVLIPVLYCVLFITASWFRPMLLARVATWLVIPLCLILAWAALNQSGRLLRYAAGAVPLVMFLFSLGYYYQFSDKEDWRGAARLIATHPRCTGPVLVSEFNALGLYYYAVQPDRPAYVFLPDPRRRNSVEFNLSERLMHLPELPPDAVAGFVDSHPGTVVIMRPEYANAIPLDLQDRVASAPVIVELGGGLKFVCFGAVAQGEQRDGVRTSSGDALN